MRIPAWASAARLCVITAADSVVELDENTTFTIRLSDAYTIGRLRSTTITIQNDG